MYYTVQYCVLCELASIFTFQRRNYLYFHPGRVLIVFPSHGMRSHVGRHLKSDESAVVWARSVSTRPASSPGLVSTGLLQAGFTRTTPGHMVVGCSVSFRSVPRLQPPRLGFHKFGDALPPSPAVCSALHPCLATYTASRPRHYRPCCARGLNGDWPAESGTGADVICIHCNCTLTVQRSQLLILG